MLYSSPPPTNHTRNRSSLPWSTYSPKAEIPHTQAALHLHGRERRDSTTRTPPRSSFSYANPEPLSARLHLLLILANTRQPPFRPLARTCGASLLHPPSTRTPASSVQAPPEPNPISLWPNTPARLLLKNPCPCAATAKLQLHSPQAPAPTPFLQTSPQD